MRTFVVWLAATSFLAEGVLYCPTNYCLMQIAAATGENDASAFSCEQYPSTTYTCDYQDENNRPAGSTPGCTCTGEMRYGNYYRFHKPMTPNGYDRPASWNVKTVDGTVPCNSTGIPGNDPASGAKICTCTPTLDYTPVRDTKQAITYMADGWAQPTCLIQKLGLDSTDMRQLLKGVTLWTAGLNLGGISLAYAAVFGPAHLALSTTVVTHEFDHTSYTATFQFNGLSNAYTVSQRFDGWRTDNTGLKDAVNTYLLSTQGLGNDASALSAFNLAPVVQPQAWDGPVMCPPNYCLNPVRKGVSSSSYTCERFTSIEHTCAGESLPGSMGKCICEGEVKFGNWVRATIAEGWVTNSTVNGSIDCTPDNFPGGVKDVKYCTCTPASSVNYSRSSMPALEANPGFTAVPPVTYAAYAAPTCMTLAIQLKADGFTAAQMSGLGVNEGLVDYFSSLSMMTLAASAPALDVGITAPAPAAPGGTTIKQEWSESTLSITAQLQGASFTPATAAATMLTDTYTTNLNGVLMQIAASGGKDMAALLQAQAYFELGYGPLPLVPFSYPNPNPTTTTTPDTTPMEMVEPEPAFTTAAPTGSTAAAVSVGGAFSVEVDDPQVILGDPATKAAFEDGMETKIAASASVPKTNVDVEATASRRLQSRRLQLAEPRQLAGKVVITYTITTTAVAQANVINNVNTLTNDVTQLQTVTQQVIRAIPASTCGLCANVTVSAPVIITAAAPVAPNNNEDSGSAGHVLWAIFSFAAPWLL